MDVPIIDLSLLHRNSLQRSLVIQTIREACQTGGIFQVINHGVPERVIEEAVEVNAEFFDMPREMKEEFNSIDTSKPVRYRTVEDGAEGNFARGCLNLSAHPLEHLVDFWPKSPSDYREKMKKYTMELRKLSIELLGAVMESLNLKPTYLKEKIEQGMQIVNINNYPPSTVSNNFSIGITPHSDPSFITILLENSPGLEVMDKTDGSIWKLVPALKGSFQVLVGDSLEILSNGRYGSVLHRVVHESNSIRRLSISNVLSLGMDEILETADELVDEGHPKKYKRSSMRDFLNFLSSGSTMPFPETLKIHMENE